LPQELPAGTTVRRPGISPGGSIRLRKAHIIILLKELFDISLFNEIYREASMSRALVLIWYSLVFNKQVAFRGNPSSNSSFLARQIWRSLKLANASG
jgi:hypothetical protein